MGRYLYQGQEDDRESGGTVRVLAWFSCGAASAVAAKYAVDYYPDCEILYCDTLKYEHPDNVRFLKDVEKWLGKEIRILKSEKYEDIYDVFKKTGWLVGPRGARCTTELKKNVRRKYQQEGDLQIFGLTYEEKHRIDRFEQQNPDCDIEWILYENHITKAECYQILGNAGIELPKMYKLGYNNNNCIGCVKGGMGYWNKIRVDFPETFERMAKLERELNVTINTNKYGRVFLDELDPNAGLFEEEDIECGVFCLGFK